MVRFRAILVWAGLGAATCIPILAAIASPLLAWRDAIYIIAGFAGIVALSLMLLQPLLAGGYLPGLSHYPGRRLHRVIGAVLVLAVLVHVGGLWITSPPDVIDALLFRSATSFSAWGVIAMWALFAAALVASQRQKLRLRTWRRTHTALVVVIVTCTVIHAVLIEGTMEWLSKVAICALVLIATAKAVMDLRAWEK